MFADLLRRLTTPGPQPLPDTDARLALGALLVRIARSDGNYTAEESARIDRILSNCYGLSSAEAQKLRADCETMESEAPDTVRFTRAIKDAVSYEDREAVIEALWDVVLADGQREEEEDSLMRMVAPMLGITDPDSARARQRVAERRGL